jgi:hypothetical protein
MKRHLKRYTSLTHYIEFLKKQPRHAQHVYGAIFAGTITGLIACFILYADYGFWHERYIRADDVAVAHGEESVPKVKPESPSEVFSRFFGEVGERFGAIKMPSMDMIKGSEVYTNTNIEQ